MVRVYFDVARFEEMATEQFFFDRGSGFHVASTFLLCVFSLVLWQTQRSSHAENRSLLGLAFSASPPSSPEPRRRRGIPIATKVLAPNLSSPAASPRLADHSLELLGADGEFHFGAASTNAYAPVSAHEPE